MNLDGNKVITPLRVGRRKLELESQRSAYLNKVLTCTVFMYGLAASLQLSFSNLLSKAILKTKTPLLKCVVFDFCSVKIISKIICEEMLRACRKENLAKKKS